jgi:hypothetical protein
LNAFSILKLRWMRQKAAQLIVQAREAPSHFIDREGQYL